MNSRISISLFLLCILCQSCFTGIESTKKIKFDDSVYEDEQVISQEQLLLSHIKRQPFNQWETGKEFVVTDDKISLIFNNSDSLANDTIKYIGHSTYTSINGTTATQIFFSHKGNDTLVYTSNLSPQELTISESFEIPFTIQLSLVNDVRQALLGKELYTITSLAYDMTDNNISQPKFLAVTICDVTVGNSLYPIKISYTNSENHSASVYMTIGNKLQSTRNFDTLFSLTNPRDKYPKISDTHWHYITHNIVMQGMTKEECRLSLGAPFSIDRMPSNAGVIELWRYNHGANLIFEDGILKDYKR